MRRRQAATLALFQGLFELRDLLGFCGQRALVIGGQGPRLFHVVQDRLDIGGNRGAQMGFDPGQMRRAVASRQRLVGPPTRDIWFQFGHFKASGDFYPLADSMPLWGSSSLTRG